MKEAILLIIILAFSACTTGNAINPIGKPATCSDTDGGKDFGTSGTVITESTTGVMTKDVDTCVDGRLIEYYCDGGNFPRKEIVSCECLSGTCI